MRGTLMRLWTEDEHKDILLRYQTDAQAAAAYNATGRSKTVLPQNVRYWRVIFSENEGNMAAADRALKAQRTFVKPEIDDDIGADLAIPDIAHSILVIPDQHAPYHHPDGLAFLRTVADSFPPDLVVNLGDELDKHAMSFHDSDPNLDSAGAELEKGKKFLQRLHKLFPNMLICHSNHGSMHYRKAKAHGIPVQYIKKYRDVLFPEGGADGWSWRYGWTIETPLGKVLFKHQPSGTGIADAAHNGMNLVTGHLHGDFSVQYKASVSRLYWHMSAGCLIDKDSLAFAYGKHTAAKPVLGCGVILEGRPMLIPMILDEEGRWIKHL